MGRVIDRDQKVQAMEQEAARRMIRMNLLIIMEQVGGLRMWHRGLKG
jgi:hypothetical protein